MTFKRLGIIDAPMADSLLGLGRRLPPPQFADDSPSDFDLFHSIGSVNCICSDSVKQPPPLVSENTKGTVVNDLIQVGRPTKQYWGVIGTYALFLVLVPPQGPNLVHQSMNLGSQRMPK